MADLIDLEDVHPIGDQKAVYFNRKRGAEFDVKAAVASDAAEIDLYDEIGYWGVTAKDWRERLATLNGRDLVVKINSPGGNVFDGIAMFNDLVAHRGRVRVEITGLAASAASIVAMAGDEIAIAENAFLMIHNAWTITYGNRHDFTEQAAVLGKIDQAIAKTYATQTSLGMRTIQTMMDDETWLVGADAKAKGFVTEVITKKDLETKGDEPKARFDLGAYRNAPSDLAMAAPEPAGVPETIRDIERELMRDAGSRTRSQAQALIRAVRQGAPGASDAFATRDAGAKAAEELLASLRAVKFS